MITLNDGFSGNALLNLRSAATGLEFSSYQLGSGNRQQFAGDDVAATAIGVKYDTRVAMLRQVRTDISRGVSLLQTADAALKNVDDVLSRMKTTAVQANSGSLTGQDRAFLNIEFSHLKEEISRIAYGTQFGNISLLDGGQEGTYLLKNSVLEQSRSSLINIEPVDFSEVSLDVGSLSLKSPPAEASSFLTSLGITDLRQLTTEDRHTLTGILENNAVSIVSVQVEITNLSQTLNLNGNIQTSTYTSISFSAITGSNSFSSFLADTDAERLPDIRAVLQEDFRDYSLVHSERSILSFSLDEKNGEDLYLTKANAKLEYLFSDISINILTQENAAQADRDILTAIDRLTGERASIGSALYILDTAIQYVSDALAGFDSVRSLFEDANIPEVSIEYALMSVKREASISMIAQASKLRDDAVTRLLNRYN